MSEAELHFLKARLQGGIRNKARRGELEVPLPIGLVYDAAGSVALDPDQQICGSVKTLFDTFRQVQSASAVVRRFLRERWPFPRRLLRGIGKGDVLWGPLDHSRTVQILHNPRYAGAYVYGRTRGSRNAKLKPVQLKVARDDWQVLIRDAHPGYITWDEFERNQATLVRNVGFGSLGPGTMPREGSGLLQGRIVCGRCGKRMRVRYQEVEGRLGPYYVCQEEAVRRAGKLCQSVRGRAIDAAISDLLLQSVAPAAIEVALAVEDEIAGRVEQANEHRAKQLARARYDAELARRRYINVDPGHRLVADTLEADWNERLRQLDALQQEHERQRAADQTLLGDEARARIRSLAQNFPAVWADERVEQIERKRMVALLIEDVTLLKQERVDIHVRFRGGATTSLQIDKPKPIAQIRKTLPEVVRAVDELLETCTDRQAAARLNELGYRNWKGQAFTFKKVTVLRNAYRLKSRYERLRERGMISGQEVARQLGVCTATVCRMAKLGLLHRHTWGNDTRALYEPPGDVVLVPGAGGRYGSKPPRLIAAPPTKQGAI